MTTGTVKPKRPPHIPIKFQVMRKFSGVLTKTTANIKRKTRYKVIGNSKKTLEINEMVKMLTADEIASLLIDKYERMIKYTSKKKSRIKIPKRIDKKLHRIIKKHINFSYFQFEEILIKRNEKNKARRVKSVINKYKKEQLIFKDIKTFCKEYRIIIFPSIKEASYYYWKKKSTIKSLKPTTIAARFLFNNVIENNLSYHPSRLVNTATKLYSMKKLEPVTK